MIYYKVCQSYEKNQSTDFIKYNVQGNQSWKVPTQILEHRHYLFVGFSYQILLQ